MDYFNELMLAWEALAETNPMWAILSNPSKKFCWDPAEFYKTGKKDIVNLINYISSRQRNIQWGRALDFGCGIGRLTFPLAEHFEEVYGIDTSAGMIQIANRMNLYPLKCKFFVNTRDDLTIFRDAHFNFILSYLVLQHIKPDYIRKYLKEFLRILAPGGLLIFQLPSERITLQSKIYFIFLHRLRKKLMKGPYIDMHCIKKERVINLLEDQDSIVLDTIRDNSSGTSYISYRYFVAKRI